MFGDVPTITEKASRAGEQLDGGGSAAVLSRLSGLWEAAPNGTGKDHGGFVARTI